MRVALVNPPWRFEHSIYFGCREPHLPLELGYARALLERAGHETLMLDGHLCGAGRSGAGRGGSVVQPGYDGRNDRAELSVLALRTA